MPQSVLPSEILKAVALAKRSNKSKHGFEAFRLDVARTKKHTNSAKQVTRYLPFEVNIKGEWVPVAIKFQNAKTAGGVKPPNKRKYGASLVFKQSTTFVNIKTGKPERYGDAVVVCNDAFAYIARGLVKSKELKNGRDNSILEFVQKQRRKDPNDENSDLLDMEDPLFRPKLNEDKEGNFRISQGIRDLRKKIPKDKRSKGQLPYELATDDEDIPLNPDNVHTFIKMATPCFGVHDLSQGCCSKQGISCPSSISLLMAKKPKGRKPTFGNHFGEDEMETWGDVDAFEEGSADGSEEDGSADGSGNEEDAGEYGDMMDAVDAADSEDDGIEDPASAEDIEASGSAEGSEEGSVDEDDLDSDE